MVDLVAAVNRALRVRGWSARAGYVGPRRQMGAIDALRLEEAVQSIERAVVGNGITLQPEPKARAVVAVYELLDRDREPATAGRVKRLIEAFAAGAGDPEDETD